MNIFEQFVLRYFKQYCSVALLLGLVFIAYLLIPNISNAQTEAAFLKGSFIDFRPTIESLPKVLTSVVEPLLAALELDSQSRKEESAAKYQESLNEIEKMLSSISRGHHHNLYFLQGLIYQQQKKFDKAKISYEKSLKLRASSALTHFRHAMVLKELKNFEDALQEFKEVAWLAPEHAHEAQYLAAECLIELKRPEEAYKLALEAVKKNPTYLPLIRQLVKYRENTMLLEPDPSKRQLTQAQILVDLNLIVSKDPNDRESSLKLARILIQNSDPLIKSSDLEQGKNLALKFAESSEYKDAEAVKTAADAYMKQGKLGEANDIIKKGLDKNPTSNILLSTNKQIEIEKSLKNKLQEKTDD